MSFSLKGGTLRGARLEKLLMQVVQEGIFCFSEVFSFGNVWTSAFRQSLSLLGGRNGSPFPIFCSMVFHVPQAISDIEIFHISVANKEAWNLK